MSIPASHPRMAALILGGRGVLVSTKVGVRVKVGVGVRIAASVRVGIGVGVRLTVHVSVGAELGVGVPMVDGEATQVTVPVRLGVRIAA